MFLKFKAALRLHEACGLGLICKTKNCSFCCWTLCIASEKQNNSKCIEEHYGYKNCIPVCDIIFAFVCVVVFSNAMRDRCVH